MQSAWWGRSMHSAGDAIAEDAFKIIHLNSLWTQQLPTNTSPDAEGPEPLPAAGRHPQDLPRDRGRRAGGFSLATRSGAGFEPGVAFHVETKKFSID